LSTIEKRIYKQQRKTVFIWSNLILSLY